MRCENFGDFFCVCIKNVLFGVRGCMRNLVIFSVSVLRMFYLGLEALTDAKREREITKMPLDL